MSNVAGEPFARIVCAGKGPVAGGTGAPSGNSGEARGHLDPEEHNFLLRQRAPAQHGIQSQAGYVLGDQKICPVLRVKVMDSGDVGMIEAGESQRFLSEIACERPHR